MIINFAISDAGPRRWVAGAVLLAAGAAVTRLLSVPPELPDLDAVNFARALESFDVARQAPHFPGYPVYVALARVVAALGAPELWALALPGVLLGTLAVVGLAWALRRDAGGGGALLGAAVLAFSPLAVLAGGGPTSDGAGLAGLALALAAALALAPGAPRRQVALVGLIAGVALGLRPSYALAAAGLVVIVPRGARMAWVAGAGAGVLCWAVPLALWTGPVELARIAWSFSRGHATAWGGTMAAAPDLGARSAAFLFNVAAATGGLPWPGVTGITRLAVAAAGLVLGGLAWRARYVATTGSRRLAIAALALAPYAAWVFVGQNPLKARHALPLVLAMGLLVAAASRAAAELSRVGRTLGVLAGSTLAVALAATAIPLARSQGREPSPAAQLVTYVARTLPPEGLHIFTGEEARLFERRAPQFRAGRPADGAQLRREATLLAAAGVEVYVTSAAPGAAQLGPGLEPVARFSCDRLVRSHTHELVLHRYRPAVARPLQRLEEAR